MPGLTEHPLHGLCPMSRGVATKQPRLQRAALFVLVLAGFWLNSRRAAWLMDDWRHELAELPDEQLTPQLRQAADLGEVGLPLLIDALFSSRESLSAASAGVLDEELHRWLALAPT